MKSLCGEAEVVCSGFVKVVGLRCYFDADSAECEQGTELKHVPDWVSSGSFDYNMPKNLKLDVSTVSTNSGADTSLVLKTRLR